MDVGRALFSQFWIAAVSSVAPSHFAPKSVLRLKVTPKSVARLERLVPTGAPMPVTMPAAHAGARILDAVRAPDETVSGRHGSAEQRNAAARIRRIGERRRKTGAERNERAREAHWAPEKLRVRWRQRDLNRDKEEKTLHDSPPASRVSNEIKAGELWIDGIEQGISQS